MNNKLSCQNCRTDFRIEVDDISYYEKIGVLVPKLCPACRAQLRLSFRNERAFYKRDCDKCKRSVISTYSPKKSDTVWCYDCWFSDDWDAQEYGRAYDTSRPFFDQFAELWRVVPKVGLLYTRSPGCEYTNISADNKDCYMIVESSNNEDSIHSYWIQECRDVVNTSFSSKSEQLYECDDCYNSYELFYSKGCHDCRNSYFLLDCKGCFDCVGCVNLRERQHCILNEQYTKEEYQRIVKEYQFDTASGVELFQKKYAEFVATQPRKYAEVLNVTNSTGNYIKHAKNCLSCFHCYDAEDNKYGVHIWRNAKDTMDCDTAGRNALLIYNSINAGLDTSHQIACTFCWGSTFAQYSMYCFNSNYIFGCAGLRKKEHCILNRQYEKKEYEAIRDQIIESMKKRGEYGDFFPAALSCFGYNETAAAEQFPLEKEVALSIGFKWEDTPRGTYGKTTKAWKDVADAIGAIDFDVTKEIFECVECQKNYRIIQNEFLFLKKLSIPFPRRCPDCRHAHRIATRGPNKLWHRACMCDKSGHGHGDVCSSEFATSYDPEQPLILYCESCYQKEIV